MAMIIGYVRPNQDDLNCEIQLQQLEQIKYDRLYREEHSSPKKRIVLHQLMAELGPEDTIAVARLFSLADSTRHLAELLDQLQQKNAYLLSVSEGIDTNPSATWNHSFHDIVKIILQFQSDLIRENTKKGLYEARQKGIKTGRPRKPDENVKRAILMYQSQKYTLAEIKAETGISKSTLYRYLEK